MEDESIPKWFDPHCHFWNLLDRPNGNLGKVVSNNCPKYEFLDHKTTIRKGGVELIGGVVVEAVVGQNGKGPNVDCFDESREFSKVTLVVPGWFATPFINLGHHSMEQIHDEIERHRATLGSTFKGIRMILNFDDNNKSLCWPQVTRNFLSDEEFGKKLKVLANQHLVFELQCNPCQLLQASEVVCPSLRVSLNHMGCLKLQTNKCSTENDVAIREWQTGMKAMALKVPHVLVKISMLDYTIPGWWTLEAEEDGRFSTMKELVHNVIDWFGVTRCCFASNFPVELIETPHERHLLWGHYQRLVDDLSPHERYLLFVKNAREFYHSEGY